MLVEEEGIGTVNFERPGTSKWVRDTLVACSLWINRRRQNTTNAMKKRFQGE
jgi:hypothetical protein